MEIAGPEVFPMDELVRRQLGAHHDPRVVVADPHTPYFGTELGERSLVADADAHLGATRYEDWLSRVPVGGVGTGRETPRRRCR